MSNFKLTFRAPGQQADAPEPYPHQQQQPPDSREDHSPTRTSADFFNPALHEIKKIAPTTRPAHAALRRPSEPFIPTTAKRAANSAPVPPRGATAAYQAHHARSLSLQHSLSKPLPEPPPPELSPTSPLSPLAPAIQQVGLGSIEESITTTKEENNSNSNYSSKSNRAQAMDSHDMSSGGLYTRGQMAQMAAHGHDMNSQAGLASSSRQDGQDQKSNTSPNMGQARGQPAANVVGTAGPSTPSAHLAGLMCNVHRTTGREPPPLVGATTTIVGDKLYVFGGRLLGSRSRPSPGSLSSDMYELDLIRRHWTKLECTGDIPPPRYFHSMCALGDTKMVCYGGMSAGPAIQQSLPPEQQSDTVVVSDVYIFDIPTRKWTYIHAEDPPQGRYAHCACILPSSAVFASHRAPLSALQHNPSTGAPNTGQLGVYIDGTGGAEMIIVGGQDASNHYIEEISVFNLRSLKWVSTQPLGKSCGAYRSVVAALPPYVTAKLGKTYAHGPQRDNGPISAEAREGGSSMLIYSNYNFLDVKLELQIRGPDGTLTERSMSGTYSPPGLRFPNGGVIDTHFVVSGTYLTSSKQEYALWALDLRTMTWSRIDAGNAVFSQGSWNRGVLWNRRNTFVVLGNRKRSLVDDYNHRRINFTNVCMVELEAFGFYDNPRKTSPMSGFISASSPYIGPGLPLARKAGSTAGGRNHNRAAEELGEKALAMRELADMDILCIGGERIPINSRIVARRWGPYFVQLLREGTAAQEGSDAATLRSNSVSVGAGSAAIRGSNATITPSLGGSTLYSTGSSSKAPSTAGSIISGANAAAASAAGQIDPAAINTAPTPRTLPPNSRPRCLYLPHTYLTVQAMLHFLYTSSLPPPSSPLCTPQILCSLLQIARPYRIDGLLEAVVERLHGLLDSRNAAAVFNATAMAAGGGRGIDGTLNPNYHPGQLQAVVAAAQAAAGGIDSTSGDPPAGGSPTVPTSTEPPPTTDSSGTSLKITTSISAQPDTNDPLSATSTSATSVSGSEWEDNTEHPSHSRDGKEAKEKEQIWSGELSSVIGLQKRGLRGLMEGRRLRERTGTQGGQGLQGVQGGVQGQGGFGRIGLGIAGS
ncbi:putative sporulation-related protein [Thermochaetoides thermophila DSM 1495]|uniref:Putative sporulation-related protein n=1 Tax=Chaetomium thermophilum (strain DSM 1495 / CBS 144.50 / IMI 039719) TaxID=759272 RepID=G0SAT6_CHATD|nr:putative sporulation-related protein [Thermochaetoides thermophila DSM 1495]EGS19316.1 putative sporulation-related protein [Thermochaetoides thermophila DSM 1495]